jgi:hypothetical protein
MSFLGLEGLHAFVTGAAGGIGSQAVKEFLGMYKFSKQIFISSCWLYVLFKMKFRNGISWSLRSFPHRFYPTSKASSDKTP